MPHERKWLPACPECGVPDRAGAVTAENPGQARAELTGSQATCSRCGTTFTVGDGTTIRPGSRA